MAAELHSPQDTTWLKKWHRSVWFCKNKSLSGSQWWMNEHSKQQQNSFCNCACSYPGFGPYLSCPPKESLTHPAAVFVAQLLFIIPLLRMAGRALAAGSHSSEFLSAFWSLYFIKCCLMSSALFESSFVSFRVRGAVASAYLSVPRLSFGCSSVGICLLKYNTSVRGYVLLPPVYPASSLCACLVLYLWPRIILSNFLSCQLLHFNRIWFQFFDLGKKLL